MLLATLASVSGHAVPPSTHGSSLILLVIVSLLKSCGLKAVAAFYLSLQRGAGAPVRLPGVQPGV